MPSKENENQGSDVQYPFVAQLVGDLNIKLALANDRIFRLEAENQTLMKELDKMMKEINDFRNSNKEVKK